MIVIVSFIYVQVHVIIFYSRRPRNKTNFEIRSSFSSFSGEGNYAAQFLLMHFICIRELENITTAVTGI